MSGDLDMGGNSITNVATLAYANGQTVAAKFVDVAGDTMTGALILPADGIAVGTTQLVAAGGNVGIGTATPAHKFEVRHGAGQFYQSVDGSRLTSLILWNQGTSPDTAAVLEFRGADGIPMAELVGGRASGSGNDGTLIFSTRNAGVSLDRMVIDEDGNVGIGTSNPTNALAVNGTIKAKEVIVSLDGWADVVFDEGYDLMSLQEVDQFIDEHGHLPGVPSASEVDRGGVKMGEMQATLLRKIEELTLHLIALQRDNEALKASMLKTRGEARFNGETQ